MCQNHVPNQSKPRQILAPWATTCIFVCLFFLFVRLGASDSPSTGFLKWGPRIGGCCGKSTPPLSREEILQRTSGKSEVTHSLKGKLVGICGAHQSSWPYLNLRESIPLITQTNKKKCSRTAAGRLPGYI